MDGTVLDVGYKQFNADDRRMAGVDASRWFFVEPEPPISFDPQNGVLLEGRIEKSF